MAVSSNSNRGNLKRSLSLSHVGLDTDQAVEEGFKSAMSRKTRRKVNKKAKDSDDSNTGGRNSLHDHNSPLLNDNGSANSANEANHSLTQGSVSNSQQTVAQHSALVNTAVVSNCSQCRSNESIIASLRSEVNELSETVKLLTAQVQMLTASLGLASSATIAAPQQSLSQTSAIQTNAETVSKTYATAARSGMVQQMQCNIVSAVYMDLEKKKKRANNVVISGLVADENFDDKAVATGMIYQEFGKQVTVNHCRRLGRKTEGKTQNLLISLSSVDEASYLISNARHLRRWNNEFVRNNVYINADLTPAEAQASYELRCARRRQRTSGHQTRERQSATNPSSQGATGEVQGVPTSSLNPSASVFTSASVNVLPTVNLPSE